MRDYPEALRRMFCFTKIQIEGATTAKGPCIVMSVSEQVKPTPGLIVVTTVVITLAWLKKKKEKIMNKIIFCLVGSLLPCGDAFR